ncbi:MAG: alpha/beta hydrolase [Myxococcales bacterium]|nr:MAG: alpha/beta hydrolase [Myxococcales bacterium]
MSIKLFGVALLSVQLGCSSASSEDPIESSGGSTAASGASPSTAGAVASGGGAGSGGVIAAGSPSNGGMAAQPPVSGGGVAGSVAAGGMANAGSGEGGDPGGGVGGTGAAGGTSFPTEPPVRDASSKVPVSKPPSGYTVEGNFAYGPHNAQRIDVIYPNGGGPRATTSLPVVLMFHGGAWIHSYTNDYGSGKDHMSTFFNRFLAHGFIVCNAEYRVNDGTADGAVAPAAVEDALLAAKWCWSYLDYFHGDRSKLVVTGASAGGHLALMVGLTTPAAMLGPTAPNDFKIAGIVSGYGPADIEAELSGVARAWIPADLPDRDAVAKRVNPITYVREGAPPLIVVQGANDNTAPVKDSQRLVNLLTAAGSDASIHLVAGAAHGFTNGTWPDAEKAMFDWLSARGIGK